MDLSVLLYLAPVVTPTVAWASLATDALRICNPDTGLIAMALLSTLSAIDVKLLDAAETASKITIMMSTDDMSVNCIRFAFMTLRRIATTHAQESSNACNHAFGHAVSKSVTFDCCICMEQCNETIPIRCGHVFCTQCLDAHIETKIVGDGSECMECSDASMPQCPMCRSDIGISSIAHSAVFNL